MYREIAVCVAVAVAVTLWLTMLRLWRLRRSVADNAEILRAVLEACGGVIVTDANANVVMMNAMAAAITGYSESSAMNLPVEMVLPLVSAENGAPVPSPVRKVMTSGVGTKLPVSAVIRAAGGRMKQVRVRAEPVWGVGGRLINTVLAIEDITLARSRRRRLTDALKAVRAAAAAAGFDFGMAGADGTNPRPLLGRMENWGRDADERPLQVESWVHPDDRELFRSQWQALLSGTVETIAVQYRAGNDAFGSYRLTAVRVPSGKGVRPGIALAIQNLAAFDGGARRIDDADKLLRKVIESLPCYMVVKDADDDDRYLIANAAWRTAMGIDRERVVGHTDFDLFDVETAKRFRREDRGVIEAGGICTCVEELPTSLGTRRIQASKTSFKDSDGRTYLLAAAIDVTGLLAAQQSAEESKLLLRAVFDHIPVGLFLKDADDNFRYRMWNGKLAEYIGVAASDVVGKTDFDFQVFPKLTEYFRRQDTAVMAGGRQVFGDETREIGGERRHYHMTKLPIRMPSGHSYLLGAFIDFTERFNLERELQETIRRQNRLLDNEQIYNACLREISSDDDYDRVVGRILGVIGGHCRADRCYITCYSTPVDFTDRSFEWTAENVEPQMDFWEGITPSEFPDLAETLESNKSCRVDRELNHPEVMARMRDLIGERFDAAAMVIGSIEYHGRNWGIIGMSRVGDGAPFTVDDEDMLKNCAALFHLAKEHALQEMRLDAAMRIRKMVLANIPMPIVLFDSGGRVVNANTAACRLVGKSERDVHQQLCWNNFCGHDEPPEDCPVRRCLASGKTSTAILEVGGRTNLITAEPIIDHIGRLEYVVESTVDITAVNQNGSREDAAYRE
ncbi:MAG: PAS domain-containing protein [Victivallaceae bacterium]|nr:PAS domain-containing protein [Victivallaceae bacterium]